MGTNKSHEASRHEEPGGDPWAAFGYLVAGVGLYGGIGYGLSVWLNASYLLPVGILVGAGFGFYLVFHTYRFRDDQGHEAVKPGSTSARTTTSSPAPIDHDRPDGTESDRAVTRLDRDDRGDSS